MADDLDAIVLRGVYHLGPDTYGRELRSAIRVTYGDLYAALDRLEARGLIRSRMDDPTPARGGRRKRLVTVTDAGAQTVDKEVTDMANTPDNRGLDEVIIDGWRRLLKKRILVKTGGRDAIHEVYVREVTPGGHIRLCVTPAGDGNWYAATDVELCEVLEGRN